MSNAEEIRNIYKDATKELFKHFRKKFQRRKVIANDVDDIWSIDLVEMPKEWINDNNGYKYILNVVDVFSKYAWSIELKNKNARDMVYAFKVIFSQGRLPNNIWVDSGKEFYNSSVKKLLDSLEINIYSTYGEHKSAVVERFNRTLKNMMYPALTINNNHKWVDILDELIETYNNKKHSSIGMTPSEASKEENFTKVYKKLYENYYNQEVDKPKLKLGDRVRISKVKGTFEKGYLPNWSEEIFKIKEVLITKPITYKLEDMMEDEVKGSFYEQEIQKTSQKEDVMFVEKILKRRKRKGIKEVFVSYVGWPSKFNNWIPEDNILEN